MMKNFFIITTVLAYAGCFMYFWLRNYAQNSLGELYFMFLSAKERRLIAETSPNVSADMFEKFCATEKRCEERMNQFAKKWHFFVSRNYMSIFDVQVIIVKARIADLERKLKN